MTAPPGDVPVLWHLGVSHYSEKARWALAWKGIEHRRRSAPGGAHMLVALWRTRGGSYTFPILELDGEIVAGSARIIAALEARQPEPPLYPADPAERRRARELERYLDEQLGPQIRLLAWHEVRRDPRTMDAIWRAQLPGPLRDFGPAAPLARRLGSGFVGLRFRVGSEAAAERAREAVLAALERLELELGDGEYLVGDSFSVADLTAAALLYPLVLPQGGPRVPAPPEALERWRAPLRERRAYRWVEEIYRRHRGGRRSGRRG